MTLLIKHQFNCTIATDPAATAAGKVTPEKWNEALEITQATAKVLGRKTAGTGATEELSVSEVLELLGTCVQGDVIFRGASAWQRLPAGSPGASLTTRGTTVDPSWSRKTVTGQGSAPTVGNDLTQGYESGSIWITTAGAIYCCTDGTVGAAVWIKWLTPAEATPAGSMFDWPTATAPSGYFLCYGQAVSRTTYANLYAVIGTTFGTGDGSTTFNLPDMRGRVSAGLDNMGGTSANRLTSPLNGDTLGATGGSEGSAMALANLIEHDHYSITAGGASSPTLSGDNSTIQTTIGGLGGQDYTLIGTASTPNTGKTSKTGSASPTPLPVIQPTIVLAKIIKY